MTQDTTTSGTGRNVVYTLKVETDPGAKAELQKFKQSVQEVFKEIGEKQAEARDQAMRGPQIPVERMQTQVQQEMLRRQHGMLQQAAPEISGRLVGARQTTVQIGMPSRADEQHPESPANDAMAGDMASMLPTGQPRDLIQVNSAGSVRGIPASRIASRDHNSGELQQSIAAVINALAKMAESLGAADLESDTRRNALLQRANRDAAFG